MPLDIARRYVITGHVQGVGFRRFVEDRARAAGVRGYVRNRDDGAVEVYAAGLAGQLAALEGPLWKGPRWSRVDSVASEDAPLEACREFRIRG